jgi:rhodanese-related sulfurtransferase
MLPPPAAANISTKIRADPCPINKVKDVAIYLQNTKPMNKLLLIAAAITIVLIAFFTNVSAVEIDPLFEIPDELVARNPKTHHASLAISAEAALYKLRQSQGLTLVDVRSRKDFERLSIPGAVNIGLYAVKTKAYLKSAPLVLVNEGFRYTELEDEARRLLQRGFKVPILDGGLPAWQRQGGRLTGDFFALDEMKFVSAPVFFREKDYDSTLVIDTSPARSDASRRLISYAHHLPGLGGNPVSEAGLGKVIAARQNKPFHSVVIFNETGEQYDKAQKYMSRMRIDAYYLRGGLAGYQKYLEGLLLSWKPRNSRMKTVSNCKPCGEKTEEE